MGIVQIFGGLAVGGQSQSFIRILPSIDPITPTKEIFTTPP
jgi:hypothetical protein